ncbi:MAG: L-glutamate gamma-semialdehyde dehydrogenase [Myxococcales bacterium]|nr:L-glutamate gamma-semialdehyde dehydrogenase [Myxococcales bacterium]
METIARVPKPQNEPVSSYAPGTPERAALSAALARVAAAPREIPCLIGGKPVITGRLVPVVMPHDHGHTLAHFHAAGVPEVHAALAAAEEARRGWQAMRWEDRLAVFLKAAELLAGRHRAWLNATTMLGQSKTCHQAEIDAACETVDFWRFNAEFAARLYEEQPESAPGTWNRLQMRPLEGFVLALTPFNFTSIAANLPTAPAMMGNTVVWKPAESQTLSAHVIMEILAEAGLPPGVINFLPGHGPDVVPPLVKDARFAGLHFTGSTPVFQSLWKAVAENLYGYRGFPRIVGETGGKGFIVAHASADEDALLTAIVRGAFEYQGQKCSAVSRVYLPKGLWARLRDRLIDTVAGLRMGDVCDHENFMGAVIKQTAFERLSGVLADAQADPEIEVLTEGKSEGDVGWFVPPTVLLSDNPTSRFMTEEFFGPLFTVFVYDEARYGDVLTLVDRTSPYGLTGAIFARDREAIAHACQALTFAAGNLYINDKPTGAVVGQQPFGGARASGTDDKAGSAHNLLRWVAPRAVKETFDPPRDYRYPFMQAP